MSRARVTIYVCVSCRISIEGDECNFDRPGGALACTIKGCLSDAGAADIEVKPVECLAVCTRPCTIALTGEDKWTYVVGDLDAQAHASEIAAAAQLFAASGDGIIPWKERPLPFRKGVIARIPPKTYQLAETAE